MNLTTIEKFLLLAKDPVKPRFSISDLHLHHALIGMLFLELSKQNAISQENEKIVLNNDFKSDDPVLTDMFQTLSRSRRIRRLRTWIIKLSSKAPKYKRTFLEDMQSKGLVRIEVKTIMGFISYSRIYLEKPEIRGELVKDLRTAVLQEKELTAEMIVLLAMTEACKMHRIFVSDRKDIKLFKAKLKKIIKDSPVANDVERSIRQVQTAIIAAITVSAAAAAASSRR
jgi:hypothetical protein